MRRFLLISIVAACSNSSLGPGANPTTEASDAGTGGGVSFGGQQDIGEFTAILNSGGIPGSDTLDANGFFNEHYAPPPQTGCTNTLCMTPGVAVGKAWLDGTHQAALQLAIDTNVDPTQYPQLPLSLVVVIDHSGSMAEDGRLDKVKVGLHSLIDTLGDNDRLAIVQFDDTVQTLATFGSGSLDRTGLGAIVDSIEPAGGTDILQGLTQGFQLDVAALDPTRQSRVILMSDGLATSGVTDDTQILAGADQFIAQGIGLTTVGVGDEFDLTLMRGLAEHGSGNFYFLEDEAAAMNVFAQELSYFTTPIALNLQVDAVAGTGWTFGEVVGSTLWAGSPQLGSMHVPAAFVAGRTGVAPAPGTGGRRGGGSMLFIALTPTGMNPPDGKVADLTLTYTMPGASTPTTQTVTLAYPDDPSETPDPPYLSAPEMAPRFAMYNMFLGLRAATELAATSTPTCAAVALEATQAAALGWNQTQENPDIAADLTLVSEFLTNLASVGADTTGEYTASTCAYGGYNGGDDPADPVDPVGDDHETGLACNASGAPVFALLPIALAAFAARRRRKR
ncbi:MAG TPA: VWA domain-containing protein [Kofleriaceae bacterium]|jgi:Ca-activated chloride channel family protein|nr:VWA domain-containing protein [Kofleriaceae bacterium]